MNVYNIQVKVYDRVTDGTAVRPGRFRYSILFNVEATSLSRARKLAKRMTGLRDKYLMPLLVSEHQTLA